jgi:hypothetical protein
MDKPDYIIVKTCKGNPKGNMCCMHNTGKWATRGGKHWKQQVCCWCGYTNFIEVVYDKEDCYGHGDHYPLKITRINHDF